MEEEEEEPEEPFSEWWSLTDDELRERLEHVAEVPDGGYRIITVHGYKEESLTKVPDFLQHSAFQALRELDLRWNRITELATSGLPLTMEILNISHNQLDKVPGLIRLNRLKDLNLSHNKIMTVDSNLPDSLEVLDLSYNVIQVMPSLDRLGGLTCLLLSYNYIHNITTNQLPEFIEQIDLSHNYIHSALHLERLTVLTHLNLSYNKLKDLRQDFPSTLQWLNLSYNNIQIVPSLQHTALKHLFLIDNIVVRILGLPGCIEALYMADVITLKVLAAECFPSDSAYQVVKKSLTRRQTYNLAQPSPHVFVHGFEHIVRYFTHNFVCNSRNRLIVFGDSGAGKTSCIRSMTKGTSILTRPGDYTQFMKIQTWKIDEEMSYRIYDHGGRDVYSVINSLFVTNKSNVFICHNLQNTKKFHTDVTADLLGHVMRQQPENNINILITHVDMLFTQAYFQNLRVLKNVVNAFWTDNINRLTEKADKHPQLQYLISLYKEKQQKVQYLPVSSKTNKGLPDLRDYLTKQTDENRTLIPDYWQDVYLSFKKSNSSFLKLDQIRKVFKSLPSMADIDDDLLEGKIVDCLRYFNDLDIVAWKHEELILRDYIFHNLGFLLEVFTVVFQDRLVSYLEKCHETDEYFQELFTAEEHENTITRLREQGFLCRKIFHFLWHRMDISEPDMDALIRLMSSFNLLHAIDETDDCDYYCPWMISNITPPQSLNQNQPLVISSDQMSLHLQCEFINDTVPGHLFKAMCVCLQRHAVHSHYEGERHAWTNGLSVTIHSTKCYLYHTDTCVSCAVCAPLPDLPHAWAVLEYVHTALVQLLQQWRGIVVTTSLACPHCVIIRSDKQYKWPPQIAWPTDPVKRLTAEYVSCPYDPGEEVATGLIQAFTRDHLEQAEAVSTYMKEHWTDIPAGEEPSTAVLSHLKKRLKVFQAIMFVEPVIKALHEEKVISDRFKEKLLKLSVHDQVESLFKRLVLRRGWSDIWTFKQILQQTHYHTNVTLAKMLPETDNVPDKDPSELLKPVEEKTLTNVFSKPFLQDIGIDRYIPQLLANDVIHKLHMDKVMLMTSSEVKASYLLNEVVLRGTYDTMEGLHKVFSECNAKHLAGMLPHRKEKGSNSKEKQETSYKEASDPEKPDGKIKEKKKKLKEELQKHDKDRRNQNITITADHDEVHDFNEDDDDHHEIASVNFNQNNSELSQSHIQLAGTSRPDTAVPEEKEPALDRSKAQIKKKEESHKKESKTCIIT